MSLALVPMTVRGHGERGAGGSRAGWRLQEAGAGQHQVGPWRWRPRWKWLARDDCGGRCSGAQVAEGKIGFLPPLLDFSKSAKGVRTYPCGLDDSTDIREKDVVKYLSLTAWRVACVIYA